MLVRCHKNLEVEFGKWIAVCMIAAAIALFMTGIAGGTDVARPPAEPGTLPPMIDQWSEPMGEYDKDDPNRPDEAYDLVVELWNAINVHRDGELEAAIGAWNGVRLPSQAEVWRHVALTAAYLQVGDLEKTAVALHAAEDFAPKNAVVNYYKAIYRLAQAAQASDWYDGTGPMRVRVVAFSPDPIAPHTRSMYQAAAMVEFERAIENAPRLNVGASLLSVPWATPGPHDMAMPVMAPTIGDLLGAIGADNFVGTSHNMLAPLYLDRGMLKPSEQHLDAAVALSMNVMDGYRDLAARYEAQGAHGDAARAYFKAIGRGGRIVDPTRKFLENLRNSMSQ